MNSFCSRGAIQTSFCLVAVGLLTALAFFGCKKQIHSTTTRVVGWGFNQNGEATGTRDLRFGGDMGAALKTNATNGAPDPRWAMGVVTLAGAILTNISAIAAGDGYSLALNMDGTVTAWGQNWRGRALGYDTGHYSLTSSLVKVDGLVLTNVIAICAGNQSIALTRQGTAVTWGMDSSSPDGQRFSGPHFVPDVIAIASGGENVATVKRDGSIQIWGPGFEPPSNVNDAVAVALSSSPLGHGIVLRRDHSVLAWGLWHNSACHVEDAVDIVAIAAGYEHYVALRDDGVVLEWGNYAPPAAVSAFSGHPAIGLACHAAKIDGRVLDNVVAVAAGGTRSMALKRDGTVVVWGTSDWEHQSSVPARLSVPAGFKNVTAIAAGDDFSLALTTSDPPLSAKK